MKYFLLLCFLLTLGHLPAQPASGDEEKQFINAEFSFYTWKERKVFTRGESSDAGASEDKLPDIYYLNGQQWETVKLKKGGFTSAYNYKGPLPVRFYTSIPTDISIAKPVFTAQFPTLWKEVLFLVKPGNGGQVNAIPVDRSITNLQPGAVRLYNLGSKPIVYMASDRQQPVKSGGFDQFSIKDLEGYYLNLKIAAEYEGKPKLAYSSKLAVDKNSRILLLAYQSDPNSPSWQMRTLVIPEI